MAGAFFLSLIALATPPVADGGDIVVEARRSPADTARLAAAYVKGVGMASRTRPVARWTIPVCPRVYGLALDLVRFVTGRIEAVAGRIGAEVGRPGCATNIAVAFTDDGVGQVKAMIARSRRMMAEETPGRRARLVSNGDPVRWWYDTEVRGADGQPALPDASPAVGTGETGQSAIPSGPPALAQYRSSIVSTLSIRALRSAFVVVDAERAAGVPLGALASYIALVSLAEIRVGDPAPSGSILRLFDERDRHRDLTRWDEAFLSSYYRLRLDRTLIEQRGRLRGDLLARMVDPAPGR